MWSMPTNTTAFHNSDSISAYYNDNRSSLPQTPSPAAGFPDFLKSDPGLDLDSEIRSQTSTSSSPRSTLGSPGSTAFDGLSASRIPRAFHPTASQLLPPANMMYNDTWSGDTNNQYASKSHTRSLHNRDSSLSSLGSMGPASPFSFSSSNPHIAVHDASDNFSGLPSGSDNFSGLPMQDDNSYQLAAKVPHQPAHDTFFANYPFSSGSTSVQAYASMLAPQRHRGDQAGLLPPPDFPSGGSSNSRPGSVASSVASDSPATPAPPEPEDDRRRKNGFTVPKLDRTMTDVYSDELYNPNFSITSTAPSQPGQTSMSPTHDMFVQRVQAANNQHLSANQSPISTISRGRSPFRQGSPLAPTLTHNQASANMRHNSAQKMRDSAKVEQDSAQVLRQTMAQSNSTGTPQTISPKDAVLEFNDTDASNNFPLFPQQQPQGFDGNQLAKAPTHTNDFGSLSLDTTGFDNFLTSQISSNDMQLPQQYPFVAKPRQELPSGTNGSYSLSSRMGSSPALTPDSAASGSAQRPEHVGADGGTYTCTYHGCSQRFETPTLLQKHKREGHRQAHGLSGLRRPEGPTATYFNTQAGPHKCERINPSTGKPCNTVFSRPYDLTRHEDTIHNGRKQKVRCDVCTEEKTFSRADALTRHYRVCHPDLEFPGKHRKRGGATN